MRKLMAVFAVLIFLFCSTAMAAETPPPLATPAPAPSQAGQAKGAVNQFSETWMVATDLGTSAAYVLDRDGQLYRWNYTDQAPVIMCTLPVATREMYMNYTTTYPFLPAENKAQIRETVSMIVSDDDQLYVINKPTGRIGMVEEGTVRWLHDLDEGCFLNENGEERLIHGSTILNHQLFLVVDYWEENPDAAYCTRIMRVDLQTGSTKLYEASEAHRICRYGDQLLLLCESNTDVYLMQFDPLTGTFSRMDLRAISGTALAYDAANSTIYLSTDDGIYCSKGNAGFSLVANMPAEYAGGYGIITNDGSYAFTGDGIWAVRMSGESGNNHLTVRLQSSDTNLKSLFVQEYPDIMLDWHVDYEMTAADLADAIRTGDTTAVFSVRVDSNFGSLVDKGFVVPLTNSDIISSVDRMYPSLSAPLKNANGQVIAYPWDFDVSTWGVNHTLWNQYFPGRELPTTWKEFFILMQEFELADNSEGDLFLMNWDYEIMLERVLSSFILRANMRGEAIDFTAPVLVDTLSELNKVRQLLLNCGIETYDEAEIFWDSEVVGDHSIFHYGQGASTRSAYLWSTNALTPFVFADGDTPVYPGNMRVLVINPNAPNKDAAEAFIAMLTSMEYGVMRDYVLHADATEPYNQRPYTITGDMIEQWQGATSAIWISTNDPLQSDAFTAQARTLIERYAAGQLNDHMFLIKLNETASMVESEVR